MRWTECGSSAELDDSAEGDEGNFRPRVRKALEEDGEG